MVTQRRGFFALIGVLWVASAMAGESSREAESTVVKIEALNRFTHSAEIPADADLSSIRFRGVKMVHVATQLKSTIDARSCEEAAKPDPGGSMYCPYIQLQSPADAYQVTYSYDARPLASDEHGSRYFTFSVNFRPEELSTAAREKLSERKTAKNAIAELFAVSVKGAGVSKVVIGDAASKVCERRLADGSFVPSDPRCQDRIVYKTTSGPSDYVTVSVRPADAAVLAKSVQ
jgi:hypothetical protein